MSLSPICTINGGATPATVGASASVSGALANPAGAAFWFLKAISCDEVTGVAGLASVNGSLVINQTTKTFSFTSTGSLGTCIIFQSTVGVSPLSSQGSGRDVNGAIQAAFTTTFKVNIPASNGNVVMAASEVTEQDPAFGWIAIPNQAARTAGFSGAGITVTLDATSASVTAGDTGVSASAASSSNVVRAVTATVANAPTVSGVFLASASPGTTGVQFAPAGAVVPASVTGLGAGAAALVQLNLTTGRMARVAGSPVGVTIVGSCDTQGNVTVSPQKFTSSAGSTATTGFTQPAVWLPSAQTTLTVPVGDSSAAYPGSGMTVVGFGSYPVTAVPDATHVTILNPGGSNASAGTAITGGSVVVFTGSGSPLAAQPINEGQVLVQTGGALTPTGHRPVVAVKSLSYNGVFFKDSNDHNDGNGNWAAVQSWLNGGPSLNVPTNQELYFGLGNHAFITRPLFVTGCNLTISDNQLPRAGSNALIWTLSSAIARYTGPAFVAASGRDPRYHSRTLNAGVNTIYTVSVDTLVGTLGTWPFLNFNDTDCGSLNGLGVMTWELFYNPTSSPVNGATLFVSPNGVPFFVEVTATGHLICSLNVTTGLGTVTTAGTLTLGALQHVVFQWDGQFFTVWIGGVKDANSYNAGSAGNTILQPFNCDVTLNVGSQFWPTGGRTGLQNDGAEYGSIRISNIARYSGSSFTAPVVELGFDNNTKLLVNFDPAQRSTVDTVLTTTTFPGTTFAPTNGNSVVPTTGTSLVGLVAPGYSLLQLGSQSDFQYIVQAVTSSNITLERAYFGTTSASTTGTATDGHPGWIIAKSSVPTVVVTDRASGAPVWYYWHGIDGALAVTENRFRGLSIQVNGDGIYNAAQQYVKVHDCYIAAHRGVTFENFAFGGRVDGCYIQCPKPGTVAMHSWGIGSGNSEFVLAEHNHVFGALWLYVVGSGSGMLLVDNYSDAGSLGILYAADTLAVAVIDPHFYLEGATPTDSLVRMDTTRNLTVDGGAIGDGTGTVPIFKINAGQDSFGMTVDVRGMVQEDTSQYVFSCPGPTFHTIKFSGQNLQTNRIMDPSNASNIALPESTDGAVTVNVTADADVVLTQSQFFAHTIILTDTGNSGAGFWTTGRNMIAPFASTGYRRQVWNATGHGHALTFKTAGGTGPSIADGANQGIGGNGTNWS